jgi:CDP-diacylglycerol--serine O-phosphatidyltransferase
MKMFNIPNLFTATNMLCGVLALLFAFAGRIDVAPYFIFLGALLDFFDGFLARILKQQSELGKQLDSLADMITFGLAPGIIIMVLLIVQLHPITGDKSAEIATYEMVYHANFHSNPQFIQMHYALNHFWSGLAHFSLNKRDLVPFSALIIPFFSLFRLAKFNIDTRQVESFIGLPTPANTIFFMAFPLLLSTYGETTGWEHDLIVWLIQPVVLLPIIVVMSFMLISELPLFALKFKSFKWQGNEVRYLFLISCGILIPLLWVWSIPIIVLLYLLFSFIYNIIRKNRTHEIQS